MFVPQSDSSDTKYIHFAEIGRISIKGGLTFCAQRGKNLIDVKNTRVGFIYHINGKVKWNKNVSFYRNRKLNVTQLLGKFYLYAESNISTTVFRKLGLCCN